MSMQIPVIQVTIQPIGQGNSISGLNIVYELDGRKWESGKPLARANLETVTIPFCPMGDLAASDDKGTLELSSEEDTAYPIIFRTWSPQRATVEIGRAHV